MRKHKREAIKEYQIIFVFLNSPLCPLAKAAEPVEAPGIYQQIR